MKLLNKTAHEQFVLHINELKLDVQIALQLN